MFLVQLKVDEKRRMEPCVLNGIALSESGDDNVPATDVVPNVHLKL